MRYKACSDAQKYKLKITGKIKSQFFLAFSQIIRSIVQKTGFYQMGNISSEAERNVRYLRIPSMHGGFK